MKIYTKSGDTGETSLWGGARVKKSHPRVSVYGTLDEANSVIGMALSFLSAPMADEEVAFERLTRIQNELFVVGSELATAAGTKSTIVLIEESAVQQLEKEIDEMEASLEPLKNFILPSGSSAGAALHLARTVIRRAERECVDLKFSQGEEIRPVVIHYLNRLSDYLFVIARFVNKRLGQTETKWIAPKV
jgi:cob(I)alamin adenosyltransferase